MSEASHRLLLQQELQQRAARGGSMIGMIAELHDVHSRRHELAMSLDGRLVATTGRISVAGHSAARALSACGATLTNKVAPGKRKRSGQPERGAEVLIVGEEPDQRALDAAAKHGLLVLGTTELTAILRARASVMAEQRVGLKVAASRARKAAVAQRGKDAAGHSGRRAAVPTQLPTAETYHKRLRERQEGFRSRDWA